MSQPGELESGRADPNVCLLWDGTGAEVQRGDAPSYCHPLTDLAVRKAAHRVMNLGELALPLTSSSTC